MALSGQGGTLEWWYPRFYDVMEPYGWLGLLAGFAILWAMYGLTILHLTTLAWHAARDRLRGAARPRTNPAAGPEPTLGYLVAVYNDDLTIGPCIESLLRQSRRPDAIVVVNDGSTDRTAEVLEGYRARGVQVLHLPHNVGKNRALEAGLQLLQTEVVAITDADVIVHPDYVKHMVEAFRDPTLDAATGMGESIPHNAITAVRQVETAIFYNVAQRAESRTNSFLVLVGNAAAYRRGTLQRIGFDHPTVSEDLSATIRLNAMGGKAVLVPEAKVYISEPPTLRAYHRQLVRWYTDFWIALKSYRQVLGKKWFGAVEYPHIALHMTTISLFHFLVPAVLAVVAPQKLVGWLVINLALDAIVIGLVALLKPRRDLWKALGTRYVARTITAWTFLASMVRVLTGTHGTQWKKVERRPTEWLLRAQGTSLEVQTPAPVRETTAGAAWRGRAPPE